jgi:hypothetical protein
MASEQQQLVADGIVGTKDGFGAADHDQPYAFGRRPCSGSPYPFSTRQYVRLLVLRSQVHDRDMSECSVRCSG